MSLYLWNIFVETVYKEAVFEREVLRLADRDAIFEREVLRLADKEAVFEREVLRLADKDAIFEHNDAQQSAEDSKGNAHLAGQAHNRNGDSAS